MQQQLWLSEDRSLRPLMRRLNRVFGEINVVLLAIAIGLTELEATCLVALRASAEMARAQHSPISAVPARSTADSVASR
jgi:hypothetical protein